MNKDIIQPSKAASTVTSNITPQKSTIEFYPYLVEKVYFYQGIMAMLNTAGIAGLGANSCGNYVVLDEFLPGWTKLIIMNPLIGQLNRRS